MKVIRIFLMEVLTVQDEIEQQFEKENGVKFLRN